MKPSNNIQKLIEGLKIQPSAGLDAKVNNAIDNAQAERKRNEPAYRPDIRRIIMRSPITKLAAAAVIIIAVLMSIYIITGKPPAVTCCAWAELAQRVEQFKSCVCTMHIKQTGGPLGQKGQKIEAKMYISSDYGYRMDMYMDGNMMQQIYMAPNEKGMITVMPAQKQYMRIVLTDEQIAQMKKQIQAPQDPRSMIAAFITSGEHINLGRSKIDGVEVEGIETANPKGFEGLYNKFVGRMWIDVRTELPVRVEIETEMAAGEQKISQTMTMDEFQWGMEVEPEVFDPNIPEDYTMLAEVKMPGQDDTNAIEGLRYFAELTNGRYPKRMNYMEIIQEATQGIVKEMNLVQGVEPNADVRQALISKAMKLQGPFMFYTKLAQEGKDPAYYGDKVSAEFGESVLMRWKVADKQYRVIFGDLTVRTVSADELAKLEAMPLNRQPKAIKPAPTDGAVSGNIVDLELSWMPGLYATKNKVYLGTAPDKLALLADESNDNNVVVSELKRDTTYYWRVDEIDANSKITTGDAWSFNTGKLVGWWKLDEKTGSTAYDASGNGNNGTLKGNPVWQSGDGLRFDGEGDYVEIADKPELDITQQITVSAWVQVGNFDKDWQAIVTKGDSAWRISRGPGSGFHFACTGVTGVNAQSPWVNGTKDVNDGKWHQVVGVYDGAELRLYIDGVLDISAPATGKIATNDKPVMIGQNADLGNREWNGLIDDVRVYNYALPENEVVELYNNSHLAK